MTWATCGMSRACRWPQRDWQSIDDCRRERLAFTEEWDWEKEAHGVYSVNETQANAVFPDLPREFEYRRFYTKLKDGSSLRWVEKEEIVNAHELVLLQPHCACERCNANPLWMRDCPCCVGCLWSDQPRASVLRKARKNYVDGRKTNQLKREHITAFAKWALLCLTILSAMVMYGIK